MKKTSTPQQSIEQKVKIAEQALKEARELARKNKISYHFPVSFTEEDYDPETDQQNKIEQEFWKTVENYREKIQKELKIAEEHINNAVLLSEEAGIPFKFSPRYCDMKCIYRPSSSEEKWPTINLNELSGELDVYGIQSYAGWHTSEAC